MFSKSVTDKRKNHEKKSSFKQQLFEAIFIILPIAFLIRTFGYGLYQVPTGSMEHTMLVGERFFADKFTNLFRDPTRGEIITFNDPTYDYSKNYYKELFQRYVWGPSNWTKRVIAIPGDEIKGVMEDNKPTIYLKKKGESEFKKLNEPYLNEFPLIATYNTETGKNLDFRTYNPKYSFEEQPYYRLTKSGVQLGEKVASLFGVPALKQAATPIFDASGKNLDEFHVKLKDNQYWAMGDNRLNSQDSRMWGPLERKQIHGKILYRLWSMDSAESWWIVDLIKHPINFWKHIRWSRCFQGVK